MNKNYLRWVLEITNQEYGGRIDVFLNSLKVFNQ